MSGASAAPPRDGAWRRARLAQARLLLVAGPESGGPGWWEAAEQALASGAVDVLQLRDKTADDAALGAAALRARPVCLRHGALLLLNDRVALAALLEADGAHVGEHDLPPGIARLLLGPERLLGVSTHDEDEVRAATRLPVDYVGLGPCYPTASKRLERSPGGPDLVARCLPRAGALPVFPIGGIGAAEARALAAAGARRLAVGSSVLRAADPGAAARALAAALAPGPSTGPSAATARGPGPRPWYP